MEARLIPELCSNGALARLVGLTERTIAGKKGDGGLPVREGKIDLRALVELGMEAAAANRAGEALDLSKERARLAKEQADRQEMLNAQARGELLARGDVDAAVGAAFARVRARMLTVPSKCAAEVVAVSSPTEAEALIREGVCDALAELSGTTVADLVAAAGEDE